MQQQTDPAAALKKWWPRAHRGDAEAQYQLGILYGTGVGLPLDLAKSAEWHRRAAEQGHDKAQAARDYLAKSMTMEEVQKAQDISKKLYAQITRQ